MITPNTPKTTYAQSMAPDASRLAEARLAFGYIERDERELPYESAADALLGALKPGTMIERHHRTWRMGQVHRSGEFLHGRIGFESEGSATELWDPERQDFTEGIIRSGVTSPFGIALRDLRIAFQLRGQDIRHQSFIGAFQALLREASHSYWIVELVSHELEFDRWRESVDRVVTMRFLLNEPNPHFGGRRMIEGLVGDTGARMVSVVLNADGICQVN